MQIAKSGALITGAASGLGSASAKMLAEAGCRVTLVDMSEERGRALALEIGEGAQFVKADVTCKEDVKAAIERHVAHFGGLRMLLNCAGIATPSKVLDKEGNATALEHYAQVVQINLVGSFNVLQQAAAQMIKNEPDAEGERGVIINTASVAAFDGQIGQAAYAASKGGVVAMTLPLAREFARYGIRVMCVAPGIFDTPMLAGLPEAARRSLGQQVPFPSRLGRPEEFALLVRQIVENTMLNGEVIRLDGALRMAAK